MIGHERICWPVTDSDVKYVCGNLDPWKMSLMEVDLSELLEFRWYWGQRVGEVLHEWTSAGAEVVSYHHGR